MKNLLDIINLGVFRGLHERKIELLTDLEDDELDSLLAKSINNKIDLSIKQLLINTIQTGKIYDGLKRFINDPKNFSSLKGLVKANDKDHLKELIEIGQELLDDDGNFNWIDTSGITDMSNLFYENFTFNGHIELWDVSNVTTMWGMFSRADSFNQPIEDWDVSRVTNMMFMFEDAYKFNLPIGDWDVSNTTNMYSMFGNAWEFNLPIGDWDVSNVTNMEYMFWEARSFNQPIGDWDVSNVIQYDSMFKDCPIDEEYKPKFK